MIIFLLTVFVISIVFLIPTILLQTNGADNGVMSTAAIAGAFGAKSNEILVKFTAYCVTAFIVSALLLSIHFIKAGEYTDPSSDIQNVENVENTETATPEEGLNLPITE